ncbi:DUF5689 domain-containing protein [Alistipes sp. OttesenSCG-928-B03]|nr:DUF5689 domain-containing protein [Alistipes sp. OttesenSCG-928-B03]
MRLCAALFAVFFVACAKSPHIPDSENVVTVAFLKSLYLHSPVQIDREMYIEGYIVSTDRYGNFHKTIVVEDDTGGIAVRVDADDYHTRYRRHDCIRINCNSLVVSNYGGALQLGAYAGTGQLKEIAPIPSDRFEAAAQTSAVRSERRPLTLTINELAAAHIGRWVRIEDVRFADGERGLTWSDPDADTDRHVVDANGNTLIVRTSRYATFAAYKLPTGVGDIHGIIGYFNGNYQLTLCSHTEAMMK